MPAAQLSGVKGDLSTKEKAEAQKVVEDLKQQMSSKSAELEKEKGEHQRQWIA